MEGDILKHDKGEEDSSTKHMKRVLRYEYSCATTLDERMDLRRAFRNEVRKGNQLVSKEELQSLQDELMLGAAFEWRRNVLQGEKDFLLAEKKKEEELLVRGPVQDALLAEFSRSLTMAESVNLYAEVREANPNAAAKELGSALRAFIQVTGSTCMAQEESA
jgi:hypothetical protein